MNKKQKTGRYFHIRARSIHLNIFPDAGRKAQSPLPVRAVMTIVIGAILFMLVYVVVMKFFRLSDQGMASFTKLAQGIDKYKLNTPEAFEIILDDETALYFIPRGHSTIIFDRQDIMDPELVNVQDHQMSLTRPKNCGTEFSCLCLCRHVKLEKEFSYGDRTFYKYGCSSEPICKQYTQWEFPKEVNIGELGLEPLEARSIGGFIVQRSDVVLEPVTKKRRNVIYVGRVASGSEKLSFCFSNDCLEKMKKLTISNLESEEAPVSAQAEEPGKGSEQAQAGQSQPVETQAVQGAKESTLP